MNTDVAQGVYYEGREWPDRGIDIDPHDDCDELDEFVYRIRMRASFLPLVLL